MPSIVTSLRCGDIVAIAATYAPTPRNATWPNVRIPEFPEKIWTPTTSTTAISRFTTTRC
jgi:hypothetical protein